MEEKKVTPWGIIPNSWKISTIKDETIVVTDYVANGSFSSLADNVHYKEDEDYAVLIRLVDYHNGFKGNFVYIDEHAYKFLSKSELHGGEIIISNVGANVGTVFRCPMLNYKMSLAPNSIMVKFKGCDDFYYYWLSSHYGQHMLNSIVTGSAQPKFNKTNFRDMKIPVPPIEEQKRIASILKSLDDKIENNRKINENLEQQAQALFKSWFVDFEPFRDQPFVESELGMIPEGWRIYSLPEIVNVYSGYSYKGSELKESKNAMATIKNFDRSGGFKVDGYKEIELSDRIKTTQYANLFDVIVAHTDLTQNAEIIGNPALILNKNGYDKIIISMDLCKVVPKTSFIPNTLLYCILNDSRFKQHALGYVNGTTVLHLNKKALPDYKIALPCDLSNLFTITKAIDPLFRAESNNIIESSRLSQLRDTLLPRLMSGELSVK